MVIWEEDDLADFVLTEEALPADWRQASLVGRIDQGSGATPVLVSDGIVHDMAMVAPTVSELLANSRLGAADGNPIGPLDQLDLSVADDAPRRLLSPIDLQCIKTALFLASDDARMCTGHDYWVDAGWR